MRGRIRSWALVGWTAATVALFGFAAVVELREHGATGDWPWAVGLMAFPVAAGLLLIRRPGNGVGRALGVVGVAAAVVFALSGVTDLLAPDPASVASRGIEALANALVPLMFGGMIALLHLFPTGRPLSRRHTLLLTVFVGIVAALGPLQLVRPGPLSDSGRPNPFGVGPGWTAPVFDAGMLVLPLAALGGLGALIVRWRRAHAVERAQLRWFMAGAAAVLALLVIINLPEVTGGGPGAVAVRALTALGLWGLPAAIVVAITRYRLYEIDRLVSRTVSYAVVVGVLAAVYAGAVFVLSSLLPRGSDLAVAGSTLLVAVLFSPLRRRVQLRVERRFNRPRFDADAEAERFADHLRTELDVGDLTTGLLRVLARTVQPSTVDVWTRKDRR
ncbi:MAG TPA: hypothetical protein VK891_06590 [Euzebyales bacterium]|nr:hypothetical protein [Euzebyales bacterium]